MIDFNRYLSLSLNAQLALCSMAYVYGTSLYGANHLKDTELKNMLAKLGVSMSAVTGELTDKGFVETHKIPWQPNVAYYSVLTEEVLGVLLFLYTERKLWVKDFLKLRRKDNTFNELHDLVRCYAERRAIPELNFIWDIEAYSRVFVPYVTEPSLSPIFNALYGSMFKRIVYAAVDISLLMDAPLDYDGLTYVVENHRFADNSMREDVLAIVAMYRFFYDGTYNEQHLSPKTYQYYVVNAIRCMHRCDYSKAVKFFAEALKLSNKETQYKNIFHNAIANYYLLMAYKLDNSTQSKTKFAQFCKKSEQLKELKLISSLCLADALSDDFGRKNFCKSKAVDGIFKSDLHFVYLFANYWEDNGFLARVASPYPAPVYKIVRHELSKFLALGEEESEELKSLYGDTPVLSSIYRKKNWELVFDNLESGLNRTGELNVEEKDFRLAYIIRDDGVVEVREQHKLKNGKWGAGKKVADGIYRCGEAPYMDKTDRRIWEHFMHYGDFFLEAESVIPFMVGVPRLFYGIYAPFEPVTVAEEHLYFEINKKKNSFEILSNVSGKDIEGAIDGVVIKKISNTEYCVIRLKNEYLPFYSQILSLKSIPREAEARMKGFLEKLGGIAEVHSEMLDGGSTLECVDGSPVISVQIGAVATDVYKVALKVRPLPGGSRLFNPGDEQTMISDEADGVRYRVRRNIKEENMNLKVLSDFVESELEILNRITYSEFETTTVGLLTLMDFVRENADICVLEWDSDKKLKLKKTLNPSNWNISMKSQNSWFEIEGEVKLDDETLLSIAQILQMLGSSRSRFVKLNDDEYIMLSDSLKRQLSRLEAASIIERGNKVRIPLVGAATLADDALSGEFKVKGDNKLKKLRNAIKDSAKMEFPVPNSLQATLRDYQLDGFQWMARMDNWGAGVCLADDMGLGKTIQTIAFLLHKVNQGASMVIAPVSVVPNWKRELERFAPSLNVTVVNSAEDREKAIDEAGAGTVVLSSYGMLISNSDVYTRKEWNAVVLDEAHAIKNRDTKTSAVIMKLSCKSRIILTGTPIQNNLGELWNLFQFINPGLLGGWELFRHKFMLPIEEDKDKERQKQLKRLIQPFMLRRTKNDVLDDLPEKNEIVLPVELTEEELSVYEFIRRRAENMLKEDGNKIEVQTLAEITRLRQAACSASLVDKEWKGGCAKIDLLMSTLENITTGGNRTLLFSQFTSFLDIVRKRLDEAGVEYLYLDGSTTIKQREKLVQRFQQGETSLFIISLKAGGLGLNLTGANYVVHLDPWWNPAIEQQATDRAHRIGQQQNVTVYHLVSKNTIEEKILRLHQSKRNIADALLEGADVSHKLTAAELLDMIGG